MPRRQKMKLIVNPVAGGGAGLRAIPKIQRFFKELGGDLDLQITSKPKEAKAIAHLAVKLGCGVVVAVGGDGTVNEVATSLVGTEVALGVIPTGNGNDFFRITGIDSSLLACCKALTAGRFRRIDVGSLGDNRFFFNALGVGLNGTIARRANRTHLLRGSPLYLYATLKTIPLYHPPQMKVRIDDYELQGRTTLIAVGNGASTGGGFRLTPFASPDDGLLDICLIEKVSKLKMFYYLPRLSKGNIPHLRSVKMFRGRKVEVESETPFTAHLDGEILGTDLQRLRADLLPKKLKVISKL